MSTQLRLPEDLHERIKRIAEAEDRSMNAQLVRFLRDALERYEAQQQGSEPRR